MAKFFDGQFVWESGYMIRELESNKTFSLLENSVITLPEKHSPTAHIYYPKEELLQIIDCSQNVFIDCNKRAIIARYLTNAQTGTYRGIVTSNEFWIGSEDGIYAKPFPIIESL